MKGFLLVLATLLLVACDSPPLESMAPEADLEFAREVFRQLRNDEIEPVVEKLSYELQGPQARQQVQMVADFLPGEVPEETRFIGFNFFENDEYRDFKASFQYTYPDRVLVATLVTRTVRGTRVITSINVTPVDEALQEQHAFDFDDVGIAHYVMLAAAIIVPLFILAVAFVCWRTPLPKAKWAWMLFILLGLVVFKLNWTTGEISFQLLSVNLLGAGFMRMSQYSPLMLSVGLPIGAIVFLAKRRKLSAAALEKQAGAAEEANRDADDDSTNGDE